ncbi:MAG: iron transporter ATP-binding protein [Oscillospiraceae bacterium]|jgi:iron complex transport system ATP-binding protein|nr:iron transporter ATP-binding protein [Oscillospiraceae bacterium]
MISVENLSCGYNDFDVANGISFSCQKGEFLTIAGPNGCGKTTVLRALAGFLPYRGNIKLNGAELSSLKRKDISSQIAFMQQISEVYFPYTVFETVSLGRYVHLSKNPFSSFTKKDEGIVLECLEKTGILEIKDKPALELSGGQLQRVFLARVFAQEPKIILLDEPTNHLDLRFQLELAKVLKEWVSNEERAIIGVFHDLNLSMELSDKVLLMENGKIADYGPPQKVFFGEQINSVYGLNIKNYMKESLAKWE